MADMIGTAGAIGPVRTAKASLWLGLIGVILIAAGAYGAGAGLFPAPVGLLMVLAGFLLGIVGGLAGLIALFRNRRSGQGRRIFVGLLLSAATLAAVGPWIMRLTSNPMIHDVSTNVNAQPEFSVLKLRADNLAGVGTLERWQSLHAATYGDIQPIRLDGTPAQAIARATAIAKARGWEIAVTTPDRLEATDTVSPFKFKDDVLVTATPATEGSGTIVNMRSVSRIGQSDFGVNAKRVRGFLADMKSAE